MPFNTNLAQEATTLTKWLISIPSVAHAKGPALISQAIYDGLSEFPYFKNHPEHLTLQAHQNSSKSSVVALVKGLDDVQDTLVLLCQTDTQSPYHYGMLKGLSTNSDELRKRLLEMCGSPLLSNKSEQSLLSAESDSDTPKGPQSASMSAAFSVTSTSSSGAASGDAAAAGTAGADLHDDEDEQSTTLAVGSNSILSGKLKRALARDEALLGLGVLESKCATGSMLVALKELSDNSVRLNLNILFICTSESSINHKGIKSCMPFLQELVKKENLKLRLCLNAQPDFKELPQDGQLHLYTGNYGKVEPSFYIIGNSSTSYRPYEGFSASIIAAELIRALELNPKLSKKLQHKPLVPTFDSLRVKEFGKDFSPDGMQVSFNLPIGNVDLDELLEVLKEVAATAIENAADLVEMRESAFAHMRHEEYVATAKDAEVVSFSDLMERASHNFKGNLHKALQGMVQKCRSEGLSLHQSSITIIERLNELARLPRPSIVVYYTDNFVPTQGLNANTSQDRELFMILDGLLHRFAKISPIVPSIEAFYAPSDANFLRPENVKRSLKTIEQECPLGIEHEHFSGLNVPTITLGVGGGDLSLLTEHVFSSMCQYLPAFVITLSEALSQNPENSLESSHTDDLQRHLEELGKKADSIASATVKELQTIEKQKQNDGFYADVTQGTLTPHSLDSFLRKGRTADAEADASASDGDTAPAEAPAEVSATAPAPAGTAEESATDEATNTQLEVEMVTQSDATSSSATPSALSTNQERAANAIEAKTELELDSDNSGFSADLSRLSAQDAAPESTPEDGTPISAADRAIAQAAATAAAVTAKANAAAASTDAAASAPESSDTTTDGATKDKASKKAKDSAQVIPSPLTGDSPAAAALAAANKAQLQAEARALAAAARKAQLTNQAPQLKTPEVERDRMIIAPLLGGDGRGEPILEPTQVTVMTVDGQKGESLTHKALSAFNKLFKSKDSSTDTASTSGSGTDTASAPATAANAEATSVSEAPQAEAQAVAAPGTSDQKADSAAEDAAPANAQAPEGDIATTEGKDAEQKSEHEAENSAKDEANTGHKTKSKSKSKAKGHHKSHAHEAKDASEGEATVIPEPAPETAPTSASAPAAEKENAASAATSEQTESASAATETSSSEGVSTTTTSTAAAAPKAESSASQAKADETKAEERKESAPTTEAPEQAKAEKSGDAAATADAATSEAAAGAAGDSAAGTSKEKSTTESLVQGLSHILGNQSPLNKLGSIFNKIDLKSALNKLQEHTKSPTHHNPQNKKEPVLVSVTDERSIDVSAPEDEQEPTLSAPTKDYLAEENKEQDPALGAVSAADAVNADAAATSPAPTAENEDAKEAALRQELDAIVAEDMAISSDATTDEVIKALHPSQSATELTLEEDKAPKRPELKLDELLVATAASEAPQAEAKEDKSVAASASDSSVAASGSLQTQDLDLGVTGELSQDKIAELMAPALEAKFEQQQLASIDHPKQYPDSGLPLSDGVYANSINVDVITKSSAQESTSAAESTTSPALAPETDASTSALEAKEAATQEALAASQSATTDSVSAESTASAVAPEDESKSSDSEPESAATETKDTAEAAPASALASALSAITSADDSESAEGPTTAKSESSEPVSEAAASTKNTDSAPAQEEKSEAKAEESSSATTAADSGSAGTSALDKAIASIESVIGAAAQEVSAASGDKGNTAEAAASDNNLELQRFDPAEAIAELLFDDPKEAQEAHLKAQKAAQEQAAAEAAALEQAEAANAQANAAITDLMDTLLGPDEGEGTKRPESAPAKKGDATESSSSATSTSESGADSLNAYTAHIRSRLNNHRNSALGASETPKAGRSESEALSGTPRNTSAAAASASTAASSKLSLNERRAAFRRAMYGEDSKSTLGSTASSVESDSQSVAPKSRTSASALKSNAMGAATASSTRRNTGSYIDLREQGKAVSYDPEALSKSLQGRNRTSSTTSESSRLGSTRTAATSARATAAESKATPAPARMGGLGARVNGAAAGASGSASRLGSTLGTAPRSYAGASAQGSSAVRTTASTPSKFAYGAGAARTEATGRNARTGSALGATGGATATTTSGALSKGTALGASGARSSARAAGAGAASGDARSARSRAGSADLKMGSYSSSSVTRTPPLVETIAKAPTLHPPVSNPNKTRIEKKDTKVQPVQAIQPHNPSNDVMEPVAASNPGVRIVRSKNATPQAIVTTPSTSPQDKVVYAQGGALMISKRISADEAFSLLNQKEEPQSEPTSPIAIVDHRTHKAEDNSRNDGSDEKLPTTIVVRGK